MYSRFLKVFFMADKNKNDLGSSDKQVIDGLILT